MEGILDIYCQSKDMAGFLNLQSKLETVTLTHHKKYVLSLYALDNLDDIAVLC